MITFIYTTDWHLRSLPSQNINIDNFGSILLGRVETILSTNSNFIIHGGDFFDSYICDDINFFNQVVDLLYKYKRKIYLVPGNHDLVGYEPKSIDWTSVGTLAKVELIEILKPGHNIIHGIPVYVVYPTKNHDESLYDNLENCIVVSHNLISPKPFPFRTMLTRSIAEKVRQCVFLCGDLHYMFIEVYENCAFFNPGPLMKMSLAEYNGSGFFEFMFEPSTFSIKYKKNIFPDVSFTVNSFEQETIEFAAKVDNSCINRVYSIESVVEEVASQLYPSDPKVKEEALLWIKRMIK
jgi:predicted phosphodiesterase